MNIFKRIAVNLFAKEQIVKTEDGYFIAYRNFGIPLSPNWEAIDCNSIVTWRTQFYIRSHCLSYTYEAAKERLESTRQPKEHPEKSVNGDIVYSRWDGEDE